VRAEREGRPLRVNIEPDLVDTWLDERAVQLAAMNLIDNALKYAHGADHVDVSLSREGANLVLRVSDNGEGIANDERDHLFERFFRGAGRLRSAQGSPIRGTGIGLALVKHVATSHGGDAWVEDAPQGGGACFALSIPIRDEAPQRKLSGRQSG
jgi:two-component system phosphate regulon sensor histidine kinase PhoR